MRNKWVICDCCEGHGRVENPAFGNGFTSSEWEEMDCDEQEDYLGGKYDVVCSECKGSGKLSIPDISTATFAEKRELVIERKQARKEAGWRAEAAAERAAEMRMGA